MEKSFNILVYKINSFRKKYYSYRVFKGILLLLLLLITSYTILSIIEYFFYLDILTKKIVVYGFLIFSFLTIIQFIVLPFLKYLKIIKPIDEKECSMLIRNKYPEIKDKLTNILELASIHNSNYSNEIILASIDQKIEELKFFDFSNAVSFKDLNRLLRYFVLSCFITVVIFIFNRNLFIESNERIIHLNQQFVRPAPYVFNLLNKNLSVKKGESIKVELNCSGKELPEIVYINIDGNDYLMKNINNGNFEYDIKSVINNYSIYFSDLKFRSETYLVNLLPKPGITGFSIKITPPEYTGILPIIQDNSGDIETVKGSVIEWNFIGIDIDTLYFMMSDSTKLKSRLSNRNFNISYKALKSVKYNVNIENTKTGKEMVLSHVINVKEDLFPEIEVTQVTDSNKITRFFFKGNISDDYGFSSLKFHYTIKDSDSAIVISCVKSLKNQEFYFSFDFYETGITSGDITYYFSVSDNDVIENYKTTTSKSYVFSIPDKIQIEKKDKEEMDKIERMMKENIKLTEEIKEDIKNLQQKNMEPNFSKWEKSQMVNQINEKRNKIEKLNNQINENFEKLNDFTNTFDNQNEEVIEKQKEIEKLMDEVFNDEIKKLLEEFKKLAEEFDEKKLNELSKDMNLTLEDLQKKMDRNLEMLKKMKVEQKLEKIIDDIEKLAINEKELANELDNRKEIDDIKDDVQKDNEKLNEYQDDLKKALEKNMELKKPLNFDDFDEEFEDLKDSFKESEKNMENKDLKKSKNSISKNSQKAENLAFGMKQMLKANKKKQRTEDIQNLKQILSNLMLISFGQESILEGLKSAIYIDPQVSTLNKQQQKLQKQSYIIRDSLEKLALRTPVISNLVTTELTTMQINLSKSLENIKESNHSESLMNQQLVVTSANNLALMLNEALENMEKKNASEMDGDQECENPGNGKPGMKMMKEASDNIKQQLEKMIEQMKKGNKMGKEMGESLMQHEMMQKMIREMVNGGGLGNSGQKVLKEIDELLEQNRKEIMNKNITNNIINRQNLINVRLLEAEKSEREREFEDKRESKSADEFYSNPAKLFKGEKDKNISIEYLNKNSHKLNNFYTIKYKEYLNNIENNAK